MVEVTVVEYGGEVYSNSGMRKKLLHFFSFLLPPALPPPESAKSKMVIHIFDFPNLQHFFSHCTFVYSGYFAVFNMPEKKSYFISFHAC